MKGFTAFFQRDKNCVKFAKKNFNQPTESAMNSSKMTTIAIERCSANYHLSEWFDE
ncbi:hypothetical protein SAMN04487965_0659 [Microbulbifer donghaiensis]|uniref:Uncharacterized protein n=1 Tax=Microbulbifer donghaiensis TaxID=494016 RepID=A0A1M4WCQ3_9GAMM|nr:hypothetical protein SAMN04487965_0659 [Microbulbifer donghaiensis]